MRTPPLLDDFIHPRNCKPICEKLLTLPFELHLHGSVGVGIQSEARAVVSQHGGQSLYIYSVLECQCCEGMA